MKGSEEVAPVRVGAGIAGVVEEGKEESIGTWIGGFEDVEVKAGVDGAEEVETVRGSSRIGSSKREGRGGSGEHDSSLGLLEIEDPGHETSSALVTVRPSSWIAARIPVISRSTLSSQPSG